MGASNLSHKSPMVTPVSQVFEARLARVALKVTFRRRPEQGDVCLEYGWERDECKRARISGVYGSS